MDCADNLELNTTRRSLLTGFASFAAWAFLPKFARAERPRSAIVVISAARSMDSRP